MQVEKNLSSLAEYFHAPHEIDHLDLPADSEMYRNSQIHVHFGLRIPIRKVERCKFLFKSNV